MAFPRCILLGVLASARLFADALPEPETQKTGSLATRIAIGYSNSYFDGTPALRQDNAVSWSDGVNSLRAGSQILGGMGSMQGKFNAVFSGGFDRYLLSWLEVFTFTNYETNVISSMQEKFLVGGGGKVVLTKSERFLFDFSLAPTFAQTQYTNLSLTNTASLSLRTRLRVRLFAGLNFSVPYFVVFNANNADDQWHSLEPSLSYALSENFDLSGGYRYRYNLLNQTVAGTIYIIVAAKLKN
ncbi:MAG: DUF481 domain-containing protein [Spirochaetes bacterium]|nr:DUF481 domain-containing protein [Spirochaetota bacterium]